MTVFVTGATGVVGSALVRQLAAGGHRVRALVRQPGAPLPRGVEAVVGDLDDADALRRGLDGAGAVVHLAAQLHVNSPSPDLAALYRRVNTEGTERLAALAAEAGVGRVVYSSTISVYGPSERGRVWTEDDEPQGDSLYARTKLAAEPAVLALDGGVVFRLAAVYGPGIKGNYPTLARALGLGLRLLPGDGANRRTLVHLDDAVQALALAVGGGVGPGLYNLTDGGVHTFDDIARSLQRAVGRRPGVRYVPAAWVRRALAVPSALADAAGRRFDGPALVDKLVEDVAVSGRRLIDRTPYAPGLSSLDAGWAASGIGRQRDQ